MTFDQEKAAEVLTQIPNLKTTQRKLHAPTISPFCLLSFYLFAEEYISLFILLSLNTN